MYDHLKTVLAFCAGFAGLCCFFYILNTIGALWKKLCRKEPIGDKLNPIKGLIKIYKNGNKIGAVIFAVAFVAGALYWCADSFFSTRELGAFLEQRGEFEEEYEAYIYIEGKPVFCIAEINKWIDQYESGAGRSENDVSYVITSLKLPYGREVQNIEDEYYLSKENNQVYLGTEFWESYKIEIGSVATERSYKVLDNTVISSYGEFCASKKGDKYHYLSCPAAANISNQNMVFFENGLEADVLQYEFCDLCAENW